MAAQLSDRERYLRCLLGQDVDRPPFWLFWGPWGGAWSRWQKEGMDASFKSYWFVRMDLGAESPPATVPVNYGPCPAIESKTIEEDENYRAWIDGWGIKRRNPKFNESMSEFLEFPVKGRDDWEKFKAERLDPNHPDRMAGEWLKSCKDWMEKDIPICIGSFPDVGFFGAIRWLLGDEECLLAFYTDPELIRDIMDHMAEVYLAVFEKVVAAGVRVDEIHIWEDMSGKQGSLISPAHFDEFMTPNYKRLRDFADRHGIPMMAVDTDGNPDTFVPPMMRGGVNFLFPMEVAAGADVQAFQEKYPTLGMMGGVDKRALAVDHDAIDAELERIRPAIERGRYIPELDHCIPSDVCWDNFTYYAEQLKKLIGKD